jgi:DNA-directed RNA polymerase specialized sigma24 family protein
MADRMTQPQTGRGSPPSNAPDVGHLLERMRSGDREAAAEFIACFGQRVRRRIQGRLRPGVRRLFDSQEIVSTLARRLDLLVQGGKLRAATENQLWALVFTMAENTVIDRNRLFERLRSVETSGKLACCQDPPHQESGSATERRSAELDRAFSALSDHTDREILSLWLQDTPHLVTARLVGLTPAAVRKRWETIKRRLQPLLVRE